MSPTAWPAATCLPGEQPCGITCTSRFLRRLKKCIFQDADGTGELTSASNGSSSIYLSFSYC
eukprot:6547457-Ditylum_brightwellii.AAC.1